MPDLTRLLGAIRFGYGLTPGGRLKDPSELLQEPARIGPAFGAEFVTRAAALRAYQSARKGMMADADEQRRVIRDQRRADIRAVIEVPLANKDAFGERLAAFWADHFTVAARNQNLGYILPAYFDEAIRPNIAGRFSDLLWAVITHPAMLNYLDQQVSSGPNSIGGIRRKRGLNENLARELLELHTLGADGAYDQSDVVQLAELLTGMTYNKSGFNFRPRLAEPGAEHVLGKSYGGMRPSLVGIREAIDDISAHPDTARHIARKLVVHFVSEDPDRDLVAHITAAFQQSGGALSAVYAALLEHPAAWAPQLRKVKPPYDLAISTLRAFGVQDLGMLKQNQVAAAVRRPLMAMGQDLMRPNGPDGWPEEAAAWITPATLAARLEFAASAAREFGQDLDPRQFVETTLGALASDSTRFAAKAAESKWEGVALVLASPEFNRR